MTDLTGRFGVVSTGTRLVDLAIDWADHSIYNHAFVINDATGALVEATPQGVRPGHVAEYLGMPMMFNTGQDMTPAQCGAAAMVAKAYTGRSYGWADIARLGLARLGVHSHWLDRHVSNDTDIICSQLVAEVGKAAGLDWSCGKSDLADVTPGLLAGLPGMQPYPQTNPVS